MTIILSIFILISQMTNVQAVSLPFELEAQYVYMINLDSDEIMYEKNAYEKMYPASLTKIMSAIVAIEAIDNLDDKLTITYEMMAGLYEANASMAGFQVGNVDRKSTRLNSSHHRISYGRLSSWQCSNLS